MNKNTSSTSDASARQREMQAESQSAFLLRMETRYALQYTGEVDQKLADEDFARMLNICRFIETVGKEERINGMAKAIFDVIQHEDISSNDCKIAAIAAHQVLERLANG